MTQILTILALLLASSMTVADSTDPCTGDSCIVQQGGDVGK